MTYNIYPAVDDTTYRFPQKVRQAIADSPEIVEHTGDLSNPHKVTKAQVGLGEVDNTKDAEKPVSLAQQTALNTKAPLNSPSFTGTPTGITKTHVGLSNVDNTSDADKQVSMPQKAAFDTKLNKALIGAHCEGVGDDPYIGTHYYDPTYALESDMKAQFDLVSTYTAIGANSAATWTSNIVPELTRNPDRRIMYAFEMWRTNPSFITEFDTKTGIYQNVVDTLQAIKDGGSMDRVYLAPFHEGNGGGNYPWEMHYTANGNTPALYKECFIRFVTLARSMGVTCKIIQWFLTNNVNAADSENVADVYVGDEWADIVGVSYYNRSGATGYGTTWTPVAGVRSFVRRISPATSRNVWICEAGCAASNSYGDKGIWYSNLVKLVTSFEIPRLEAAIMFLRQGTTTNMQLETSAQKTMLADAINARKRGNYWFDSRNKGGRNLFPKAVQLANTVSGWGVNASTLSVVNAAPKWSLADGTALQISKVASAGLSSTDYTAYRSVDLSQSDYVIGSPYVLSVDMRASIDGALADIGIRQGGGTALFSGERSVVVGKEWQSYVIQVASTADDTVFRLPQIQIGKNAQAMWLQATNFKLEPGSVPTPLVDVKRTVPAVVVSGVNLEIHVDRGEYFTYTAVGNRTLLGPIGTPVDGQEFVFRFQQDAVGGRTLTFAGSYGTTSITKVISTAPNAVDMLTFQYVASLGKWYLVRCVNLS